MVWVSGEEASRRRDKGEIRHGNQREDQIVNDRHVMSSRMLFEAGLVFMQGYISGIVQAVFDVPVGAQHFQQLSRSSLFGR